MLGVNPMMYIVHKKDSKLQIGFFRMLILHCAFNQQLSMCFITHVQC